MARRQEYRRQQADDYAGNGEDGNCRFQTASSQDSGHHGDKNDGGLHGVKRRTNVMIVQAAQKTGEGAPQDSEHRGRKNDGEQVAQPSDIRASPPQQKRGWMDVSDKQERGQGETEAQTQGHGNTRGGHARNVIPVVFGSSRADPDHEDLAQTQFREKRVVPCGLHQNPKRGLVRADSR